MYQSKYFWYSEFPSLFYAIEVKKPLSASTNLPTIQLEAPLGVIYRDTGYLTKKLLGYKILKEKIIGIWDISKRYT